MFLRLGRGVSINLMTLKYVQEWADGSFTLTPAIVAPGEPPAVKVPAEEHDVVVKALNHVGWYGRYQAPPPAEPTEDEYRAMARKAMAGNHSRILVPPEGANLSSIR